MGEPHDNPPKEEHDSPFKEKYENSSKKEYNSPPENWGEPLDYLPKKDPSDYIVSWDNDKPRGVYMGMNYEQFMFINIDEIVDRVKEVEEYGNADDINYGSRKNMNYYTGNKIFDCQRLYYCCLDIIFEHSIEVCQVHLDLSQYEVGGSEMSSWMFRFECKKGNYEFELEFIPSLDCHPGILLPKKLKNILNNIDYGTVGWNIIRYHCDFFCQNASKIDLEYFLRLLDSINYDHFIETNYGHILELPKLLEENKFQIKEVKNIVHGKSIKLAGYSNGDLNFNVVIEHHDIKSNKKREYRISPYASYEESKYKLRIINESNGNSYYSNHKSYYVEYYSTEDIQKLVNSINMFILYDLNEYGFMDKNLNCLMNDSHIKNVVLDIIKKKICCGFSYWPRLLYSYLFHSEI